MIALCGVGPWCVGPCAAAPEDAPAPTERLRNTPDRVEEFIDWGLGVFVHWSFDSQLGSVISHSMVGASDKYLDRYMNELPKTFNPTRYDPDAWMATIKLAGAKYVVLTTKHHNGFCMWDTQTTGFSVMNTPHGKDLVRPYVEACRRHGLKVGFYFSPEDFHFLREQGLTIRRRGGSGEEKEALLAYNTRQLEELFGNYGDIDVIFFDGRGGGELVQYVHRTQPGCVVTRGEMSTPEQRLPRQPSPGPWEACFTLGTQWQFKPTNESYKSGTKLTEMLIETRAKGGNLLINLGPEPSGELPFEQTRTFRELGLWMFVNDEAIHNVRPAVIAGERGVWYTRSKDGKSVYAFLTEHTGKRRWKRGERKEVTLKRLRATEGTSVSVLGQNDQVLEYKPGADVRSRFEQTESGLTISVVRAQRLYNDNTWPNAVVVKLTGVEFVE